jgi:hypothetical protein
MGFVYLLMSTDSDGLKELFKIGVTKTNIGKRIKALSTGNPNRIILIDYYESKNYSKIEKWLHNRYFIKKTDANNEWFCLEGNDVKSFKETCKKIDETILILKDNPFYK